MVNQSEHLIYETEKNINEHADKLEESEKGDLNEKVESLRKAKENGSIDDIKSSMDALNASCSALASKLYDTTKQDANTSDEQSNQEEYISSKLPLSYGEAQISVDSNVFSKCGNCLHLKYPKNQDNSGICNLFKAKINLLYWCKSWKGKEIKK